MNLSYLHKCPKDAKNGTCLFCFLLHKPAPCTQVLLRDLAPEIKGYEAETGFTPAFPYASAISSGVRWGSDDPRAEIAD
jgi:hypothetical protein